MLILYQYYNSLGLIKTVLCYSIIPNLFWLTALKLCKTIQLSQTRATMYLGLPQILS